MNRIAALLAAVLIGVVGFFGWRRQKADAQIDIALRRTAGGLNQGGEFDESWLDAQRNAGNL